MTIPKVNSVTELAHPSSLRFDDVREELVRQYEDIPYDLGHGLPVSEVKENVSKYLRSNAGQPHVIKKAKVLNMVLSQAQIYVDPNDRFVDKINHGGIINSLYKEWYSESAATAIREAASWFQNAGRWGLVRGGLDTGHIAPGWDALLARGLTGLSEDARLCRERLGADATVEQLHFYEAVEIVCQGVVKLAERFSHLANEMAESDPEHEAQLRQIASVCARAPAYPAQTFHQALQTIWLMHELIQREGEGVRSLGHFDRTLYPYYKADMDSGRITREEAKELLKFLWVKNFARSRGRSISGKNMVLGGQYPDGRDVTNDLTFLCLEAYEELDLPDPKFSVRFHPGSPDALYERIGDMTRRNKGSFVLLNDVSVVEALRKRGKTLEDARKYLSIGCYEPAVDGKETPCTSNLFVNMVKSLELALHNGVDPITGEQVGPETGDPLEFSDFEEMFDAYTGQMDFTLSTSAKYVTAHEQVWSEVNPSPLLACSVEDCLSKGKDIGQGGAVYNTTGCIGVGLANVADSLMALKQAVFEEKRFTMSQILDAMARDFDGTEDLRQYLLNRVPKYGNNNADADAITKRVADHYCGKVHSFTNARGGTYQAALYSFTFQWKYGKQVGALPDGRKAFVPLAPGVGPMVGRDKEGITALFGSVSKLDFTETPDGSVLDIKMHPSAVKGEKGLASLVSAIKTFFAEGGFALQFNIVDEKTLLEAQRNPEQYESLQVRVTGYSAYFTKLSKYEQDQIIAQNTHGL